MRYIRPAFYDSFHCTADKCPDTCCAGWQIMIDEDSLERYSEVKGIFGRRLRNSIDWEEGAFLQYNRRCAFLNEENLCDVYAELGSEALCDTCHNYPRHIEEYESLRELSLSLSCPVAAEMILSQQGVPEFVVDEDDEAEELEEEFEDFDLLLFTQLEDARSVVFDSLRKNNLMNMGGALELAKQMQDCVEDGKFFEMDSVIAKYQEMMAGKDGSSQSGVSDISPLPRKDGAANPIYQKNIDLYATIYKLERLREEWTKVLEETYQVLYSNGEEAYHQIRNEFDEYLKENPFENEQWENTGLQLFVFFVYTYFCGAVYDDWIYSKMALAVHSVEFIRELYLARWKKQKRMSLSDYVELAYRYAREIEHSDLNLNELEEKFMEDYKKVCNVS